MRAFARILRRAVKLFFTRVPYARAAALSLPSLPSRGQASFSAETAAAISSSGRLAKESRMSPPSVSILIPSRSAASRSSSAPLAVRAKAVEVSSSRHLSEGPKVRVSASEKRRLLRR